MTRHYPDIALSAPQPQALNVARFEINGHSCRIVTVEDAAPFGTVYDLYIGREYHGFFGSPERCRQEAQSLVGPPWWHRLIGWLS